MLSTFRRHSLAAKSGLDPAGYIPATLFTRSFVSLTGTFGEIESFSQVCDHIVDLYSAEGLFDEDPALKIW